MRGRVVHELPRSRRLASPTYAWFAGWLYVWTIKLTVTETAYFVAVWLAAVFGATPSPNQQVLWALGSSPSPRR